jgi:LPS-assembly lipoprotein
MRNIFKTAVVVLLFFGLSACGFHARGTLSLPAEMQKVYLAGIAPNDPFAQDFGQLLTQAGGSLTQDPKQASSTLRILRIAQPRRAITLSQAGRATEYDLFFRIVMQVSNAKGETVLPQQEIEIKRDYYNDQRLIIAQGEEEALIRSEMRREAAQAVLRRLVYALKNEDRAAR